MGKQQCIPSDNGTAEGKICLASKTCSGYFQGSIDKHSSAQSLNTP